MIIMKKAQRMLVIFLVVILMFPSYLFALPNEGQIISGQGTITSQTNHIHIKQNSQKTIINWRDFSIAAHESVVFSQPNISAIALNRVIGLSPSLIDGALSANGSVFLINPNGIMVGPNGLVDVQGFLASTLDMANDDFLSNQFHFSRIASKPLASIINQGTINAHSNGYVSLLAPGIENSGTIIASLGKVVLGSGEKVTLTFLENDTISFAIDDPVKEQIVQPNGTNADTAIHNSGKIQAEGGMVLLQGETARDLVHSVVNNDGIIEAQSLVQQNGVIRLIGGEEGTILNSGQIDVSHFDASSGGTIQIQGKTIALTDASDLDASGDQKGGIIQIGGGFQGTDSALPTDHIYVGQHATLSADAENNGQGGNVVVWADGITHFHGTISARGGEVSGDGGMVEVSGKDQLVFTGSVDTRAPHGKTGYLLLDPTDIVILDGKGPGDLDVGFSGSLTFGQNPGTHTISEYTLESLSPLTNIRLQADNSITINNLSDNELTLNQMGTVEFITGANGFSMDISDKITLTGGDLIIDTLGSKNNASPAVDGPIYVGSIQTSNGGDVTLRGSIITLMGPIVGGGSVRITNYDELTLYNAADISISGAFLQDGIGKVNLGADISAREGITFSKDVSLTYNQISLSSTRGNIFLFESYVDDIATNCSLTLMAENGTISLNDIAIDQIIFQPMEGNLTLNGDIHVQKPFDTTPVQGDIFVDHSSKITTEKQDVILNSDVALKGDLSIDTGIQEGHIRFGGTIDGNYSLNISAGTGNVQFDKAIGKQNSSEQPVKNVIIHNAKDVAIQSDIQSTGNIQITSSGIVSTQTNSTIQTKGAIEIKGASAIQLGANMMTSSNNITLDAPVTLMGNVSLSTGLGDGDIFFKNTLDGIQAYENQLNITTSTGNVRFFQTAGATVPLGNVTISSAQNVVAESSFVANGFYQHAGTGFTQFADQLVAYGQDISIKSHTLVFDSTIDSNGHHVVLVADHISLPTALNANGAKVTLCPFSENATMGIESAFQNFTFSDAILDTITAAELVLGSLEHTGSIILAESPITQNKHITLMTQGTMEIKGDITLTNNGGITCANTNSLAINGNLNLAGSFLQSGTGEVQFGGSIHTNNKDITFNAPVTLTHDSIFDSGNIGIGTIQFMDTLDGTYASQFIAGSGDIKFNRILGPTNPLSSFSIISAHSVQLNDMVYLLGNATLSANSVHIEKGVNTQNNGNVSITNTGPLSFGQNANLELDGSFIQMGSGAVQGDSVNIQTTNDDITVTGNLSIKNTFIANTGQTGPGNIVFHGTIDGTTELTDAIQLNAGIGDIFFNQTIGQTIIPSTMTIETARNILLSSTTKLNQLNITNSSGTTSINGLLSIKGSQGISIKASSVMINASIDTQDAGKGAGLSIDASQQVTIADKVYINLDGVFHQIGAGKINIAGSIATTNDLIDISGKVTLAGDAQFTTGIGPGSIIFRDTLDGKIASQNNITLNAGTGHIDFMQSIGNNVLLGNIDILNAGHVTTYGPVKANMFKQRAGTGLTLLQNILTLTNGLDITTKDIEIQAAIDTAKASKGGSVILQPSDRLTIRSTTDLTLDGSFIQNGNAQVTLGSSILTTGDDIVFNGQVVLNDAIALNTGTGAGNIEFKGSVDATNDQTDHLSLLAGTGHILFNQAVGKTKALGDIMIESAADVMVKDDMYAQNFQQKNGTGLTQFDGALNMEGTKPLDMTTKGVTINGAININTENTAIEINVSNAFTLQSDLSLNGPLNQSGTGQVFLGASIQTTQDHIHFSGDVTLLNDITLSTDTGPGDIRFFGAVNGQNNTPHQITLRSGTGSIEFTNAVGSVYPIDAIFIGSANNVTFQNALNGRTFIQQSGTGLTEFKKQVRMIGEGSGINISTQQITVHHSMFTDNAGMGITLMPGQQLTLMPDAAITCGGMFYQKGNALVYLAGSLVTTGQDIMFEGPLNLNQNMYMSTGQTAGSIQFKNILNGAYMLTLSAGTGQIIWDSPIGSQTPIKGLSIQSASHVIGNASLTASDSGMIIVADNLTTTDRLITVNNGKFDATITKDMNVHQFQLDGSFIQKGNGSVYLNSDILTTGDAISFIGPVTLLDSIEMNTGAGPGSIVFYNTIDSAATNQNDLKITAGTGNITFSKAIGLSTSIGNLSIMSAMFVTAEKEIHAASLDQASGFATTEFKGPVHTYTDGIRVKSNSVTFQNNVDTHGHDVEIGSDHIVLPLQMIAENADVKLYPMSPDAGIGLNNNTQTVQFSSEDINNMTAGRVIIGNLDNNGGIIIGTGEPIELNKQLSLISDGPITIESALTTKGTQLFIVQNNGKLAIKPNVAILLEGGFQQTGSGIVELAGSITTKNQGISFQSDISLIDDSSISTSASAGNILFGNHINGNYALTINAGTGNVQFSSEIGDIVKPTRLIIETADQITVLKNIYTQQKMSIQANQINMDGQILSGSDIMLAAKFNLNATESTVIATNGDIQIGDTILDGDTASLLTLDAGGGSIYLNGAILDQLDLVSARGGLVLKNNYNISKGFSTSFVDGNIQINGPVSIHTSQSAVVLKTAIDLNGNLTIQTGDEQGDIVFNNIIDGYYNISLLAGTGSIQFDKGVGKQSPVSSISIQSAQDVTIHDQIVTTNQGAFQINHAGKLAILYQGEGPALLLDGAFIQQSQADITLSGGIKTTGDPITIRGHVTINGAVALNTGDVLGGDIICERTINGTTSNSDTLELAAGTGNIQLMQEIGKQVSLGDIMIPHSANISIQQSLIGKSMVINHTGRLTLNAGISISLQNGFQQSGGISIVTGADIIVQAGNILMQSPIEILDDSIRLATGNGTIQLNGTVNNSEPKGTLALNAGQGKIILSDVKAEQINFEAAQNGLVLNGSINAIHGIDTTQITGAITLGKDIALQTSGEQGIHFGTTLDGSYLLTIQSANGPIILDKGLGKDIALKGLLVESASRVETGGNIQVSGGSLILNCPLTLLNDIRVSVTGKDSISIKGAITDKQLGLSCIIVSETGDISIVGADIGGLDLVTQGNLNIKGTINVTTDFDLSTIENQIILNGQTDINTRGADLTISSPIVLDYPLAIQAGKTGHVRLTGELIDQNQTGSLHIENSDTVDIQSNLQIGNQVSFKDIQSVAISGNIDVKNEGQSLSFENAPLILSSNHTLQTNNADIKLDKVLSTAETKGLLIMPMGGNVFIDQGIELTHQTDIPLEISKADEIHINGNITIAGNITLQSDLLVANQDITTIHNGQISLNHINPIQLNATIDSSGDVLITSGNGIIMKNSGNDPLMIKSGGQLTFTGENANIASQTSLSLISQDNTQLDGSITVVGDLDIQTKGLTAKKALKTIQSPNYAVGQISIKNQDTAKLYGPIDSAGPILFHNTGGIVLYSDMTAAGNIQIFLGGGITLQANMKTISEEAGIEIDQANLTLMGDYRITTQNGAISLQQINTPIGNSHTLNLDAGTGNIAFKGTIGSETEPLGGLIIENSGHVVFQAQDSISQIKTLTIQNTNSLSIQSHIQTYGNVTFAGQGDILLGGRIETVQNGANISFDQSNVILTDNSQIKTNNGAIQLKSVSTNQTGQYDLDLDSGNQTIQINGSIGTKDNPIGMLTVSQAANMNLLGETSTLNASALNLNVSGDIRLDADLSIAGNIDIQTTNLLLNGNIETTGLGQIDINHTGNADLQGNIVSSGNLIMDGTGAILLSGTIKTTGIQSSIDIENSSITLRGNQEISTNNGNMSLSRIMPDLPDERELTLSAGNGTIQINDQIGDDTHRLSSLIIEQAGNLTLSGKTVSNNLSILQVTGETRVDADISINGNIYISTQTFSLNGNMTADNHGAVSIKNTGKAILNGDINAGGNVLFSASGDVILSGSISTKDPKSTIKIMQSKLLLSGETHLSTVNGDIVLDEIQRYPESQTGSITLQAGVGNIEIDDQVGLSDVPINGFSIKEAQNVHFNTEKSALFTQNTLDIKASGEMQFDASVYVEGNIAITSDTLQVNQNMTTMGTGGSINLAVTGDISVSRIRTSNNGQVNMKTTNGDILFDELDAGLSGDISLSALGTINGNQFTGGSASIKADTIGLSTTPIANVGYMNITLVGTSIPQDGIAGRLKPGERYLAQMGDINIPELTLFVMEGSQTFGLRGRDYAIHAKPVISYADKMFDHLIIKSLKPSFFMVPPYIVELNFEDDESFKYLQMDYWF